MTIKQIKNLVEKNFNVNLKDRRRNLEFTSAKFTYYKLARKYTNESLSKIGSLIGYDHATVLNGINKIDDIVLAYPKIKELHDQCKWRIMKELDLLEEPVAKKVKTPTYESTLRDCELDVLTHIKDMSDIDVSLFIDSRLKPYQSMLKSKVTQQFKTVKGAERNRTSKIYNL